MITAQSKYKRSRGWLYFSEKQDFNDGNGYFRNGYYHGKEGIVTIYVNTRNRPVCFGKGQWLTCLHFIYNGYEYSRYYSREFSDLGLCKMCCRFLRDVVSGKFETVK